MAAGPRNTLEAFDQKLGLVLPPPGAENPATLVMFYTYHGGHHRGSHRLDIGCIALDTVPTPSNDKKHLVIPTILPPIVFPGELVPPPEEPYLGTRIKPVTVRHGVRVGTDTVVDHLIKVVTHPRATADNQQRLYPLADELDVMRHQVEATHTLI